MKILSNCCKTTVDDNGKCNKCGMIDELVIICPDCNGEGKYDVIDYNKINSQTISPPYITVECDNCQSTGYIVIGSIENL